MAVGVMRTRPSAGSTSPLPPPPHACTSSSTPPPLFVSIPNADKQRRKLLDHYHGEVIASYILKSFNHEAQLSTLDCNIKLRRGRGSEMVEGTGTVKKLVPGRIKTTCTAGIHICFSSGPGVSREQVFPKAVAPCPGVTPSDISQSARVFDIPTAMTEW